MATSWELLQFDTVAMEIPADLKCFEHKERERETHIHVGFRTKLIRTLANSWKSHLFLKHIPGDSSGVLSIAQSLSLSLSFKTHKRFSKVPN